jgi:membrane protein
MRGWFEELWEDTKKVTVDYVKQGTWRQAAAIAFYSLFAAGPLLLFVLHLGSWVMQFGDFRGALIGSIETIVGKQGANAVEDVIGTYSFPESGWLGYLLGLWTLLFGGFNAVSQLREAMNGLWPERVGERRELAKWSRYLVDIAFVIGFGLLLIISMVVRSLFGYALAHIPSEIPASYSLFRIIDFLLLVAALFIAVTILFRYLPDRKLRRSSLFAGALVTSVLFAAARALVVMWLSTVKLDSAFGSISSMIVFLVWVYVSAQILLYGASFAGVFESRREAAAGGISER